MTLHPVVIILKNMLPEFLGNRNVISVHIVCKKSLEGWKALKRWNRSGFSMCIRKEFQRTALYSGCKTVAAGLFPWDTTGAGKSIPGTTRFTKTMPQ